MDVLLIFVVETDKKCNSDWIYIKDTVNHFYRYDHAHLKLCPVYMNGKGNYQNVTKKVKKLSKEFCPTTKDKIIEIIYCFDCDKYDTCSEDKKILDNAREFCKENNYKYVWFYKDIESVYLGRQIPNTEKKKEAEMFKAKNLINEIDKSCLLATCYSSNKSNLLTILNQFNEFLFHK